MKQPSFNAIIGNNRREALDEPERNMYMNGNGDAEERRLTSL